MTDWNAWSHIIDAAQDPQHRAAVQQFLAQTELSAELPAALDEKFLAPRRPVDATGEQCAYLLCNLGFAALVQGSAESAAFAMACGQVANGLAPDVPDLALRRLFLSTKGALVIALLTEQPHLAWDEATTQCTAYLDAIDQHLAALPPEAVEGNAMAAFSFAGQCLSRIADFGAIGHYACEVASLVATALRLEGRLPPALVSRIHSTSMPGTDARALFHQRGAEAERVLQIGEASTAHAARGLDYVDAVLAQPANPTGPRPGQLLRLRAELLLMLDRDEDAAEIAGSLQNAADATSRVHATVIDAKRHLKSGDSKSAMELLAPASPSVDEAVDAWCAQWTAGADDGEWARQPDASPHLDDIRQLWGLEATAAAVFSDAPATSDALDRLGGFLANSFKRDRQQWAERLRPSGRRPPAQDRENAQRDAGADAPQAALDTVFGELSEGSALLQLARTEEGWLSLAATRRDGEISFSPAIHDLGANKLRKAHKAWSRVHNHVGGPDSGTDPAAAFAGVLDEVGRTFGDVLHDLLDKTVTQLVLIGDDVLDIPLHAARTDSGDERWIDRVPMSYVPSLSLLRAGARRTPLNASQRKDIEFRYLAGADARDDEASALAAILASNPVRLAPPGNGAFRESSAASRVLHLSARLDHNARLPFDLVLGAGEQDISLAELVTDLDLPHCEVVSNFACASALPSMLRAPGFDLAAMFLAAGARNVLASSWQIENELASEMTQAFFRYWVAGESPAAAFRCALRDLRSKHPSLPDDQWAGMRLVGAP